MNLSSSNEGLSIRPHTKTCPLLQPSAAHVSFNSSLLTSVNTSPFVCSFPVSFTLLLSVSSTFLTLRCFINWTMVRVTFGGAIGGTGGVAGIKTPYIHTGPSKFDLLTVNWGRSSKQTELQPFSPSNSFHSSSFIKEKILKSKLEQEMFFSKIKDMEMIMQYTKFCFSSILQNTHNLVVKASFKTGFRNVSHSSFWKGVGSISNPGVWSSAELLCQNCTVWNNAVREC